MKAQELRELTVDELTRKIEEHQTELFNLRFQKAKNLLDNPARLRLARKEIARIKTIITEKTKARG
ncbi:MAG TPA: 50S ribosomal protein L29 [Candidatus Cloacimonadota bacterium]|nr:50S ribosomal protein L29 [Candidatus Cloacimonadota bacterium]HPT71652.1 50S ribosomal protein L29 [Candidatus Cloacimonadota bacterium]